jgi:hypothetical protein
MQPERRVLSLSRSVFGIAKGFSRAGGAVSSTSLSPGLLSIPGVSFREGRHDRALSALPNRARDSDQLSFAGPDAAVTSSSVGSAPCQASAGSKGVCCLR